MSCSRQTKKQQLNGNWRCNQHPESRENTPPVLPTPACTDPDKECSSCQKSFKATTSPLNCDSPGCPARSHAQTTCSGLNRKQQKNPRWRCPKHDPSNPTNQTQPQPPSFNSYILLSPASCVKCDKTIKTGSSPMHCSSCTSLSHVSCTGINRYRLEKARHEGNWTCCKCQPQDPSAPPSPPPRERPKKNCHACKNPIYQNARRLDCSKCQNSCHLKPECNNLTRDTIEATIKADRWLCSDCSKPIRMDTIKTTQVSNPSEPKLRPVKKDTIKILQWNADGINPKIHELTDILSSHEVDIAMIQESKLTAKQQTPVVEGYAAVRSDRQDAKFPGGGLITYVHHSLPFRNIGRAMHGNVEAQSISVLDGPKSCLNLINLYIPPRADSTDISWLPINARTLIAGDLNGHSPLWEDNHTTDPMGEQIEDLMAQKNLTCLNTGEATHVNRATGNGNTPDITLVTQDLSDHQDWRVMEDMGSDHLPILITVRGGVTTTVKKTKAFRWRKKGDMPAFTASVEEQATALNSQSNGSHSFPEQVKHFSEILVTAGLKHVGKTKPRAKMTLNNPKILALRKKRNALRTQISEKREEWLQAAREVREAEVEAKESAWVEFIEDLEGDPDTGKVWRTIRGLSGSPDSMAPNEAIIKQGRVYRTDRQKADAFAHHYASVSRLTFNDEERRRNMKTKRKFEAPDPNPDHPGNQPFSMDELKAALKRMKSKGAPGMDDITPAFLQNLGPVAMAMMLDLFNLSFNTAKLPQSWRTACIIPLLKGGKPASEISSYRPISLTSCMVKALERMVANRIYYLAETQGWLSNYQAGFRKQRNTEDQILRITQSISDGFQKKPHQRTVMALLDYSKAFDRVWIEDLLNDMLDLGIPMKIMKWVRAFLFNRRAVAQVNNTTSSSVAMRQGLPQGSVLSPLLFLFYINGLEGVIPEGVDKALFADDASVWAQDTDLKRAEQRVQLAVEAIYAWSLKKKMELNVLKSEATFFSNSSKEAQWSPKITLAGTQMPFNDSPKFLGVHLDRTLSFQTHVLYAAGKVSQRCRILASLASKEWGWRKQSLRTVFLATQRSVIDYASPAWQPYISATQMDKLDVAQNKALRLITGHHLSTPREALRIEAGVSSCTTYRDRNAVIAYEKALRLPKGHPRRTLAAKEVPHRTMAKGSWRKCAKDISTSLPTAAEARENFPSPFVRPWAEGPLCPADSRLEIHSYLPGRTINKKKEDMTEKETADLRGLALEVIDNYNAELVTYTDGSCKAGTTDGGAAAVFTTGPAAQPAVLETLREKGRKFTSSYEEEKAAMTIAAKWLATNKAERKLICTDSQSLTQALSMNSTDTTKVLESLNTIQGQVTIQWIPAHIDIPGNELADTAAKEATLLEGPSPPISFSTVKAVATRMIKDPELTHDLIKRSYSKFSTKRDREEIHTRKDGALIAQLRTDHCIRLASYRYRIGKDQDDTCPHCNLEAETVDHWVRKCPAHDALRLSIFGQRTPGLEVLGSQPGNVLKLARATLL